MKYVASFLASIVIIASSFVPIASAASTVTISISPQPLAITYLRDFDFLVGDFSFHANQLETLQTITLNKGGNARETADYTKVVLWADADGEGFQGWGFDTNLGEGMFLGGVWIFDNLDYSFSGDQRFFVTIETGGFVQNKSLNFRVSQKNDKNDDGIYQNGESGVFFQSGVMEIVPFISLGDILIRNTQLDAFPPKGFVTQLDPEAETTFFDTAFPITLSGEARDRNSLTVNNLMVVIGEDSFNATSTSGSFATWEASVTLNEDFYQGPVYLKIIDGAGNTWTSPEYQVLIDNRTPLNGQSTLVVDQLPANIEKVRISHVLKDKEGNRLPGRTISLVYDINNGLDQDVSVITDDNGEASFNFDANPGDLINARAVYKGEVLAEANFTQTAPPVIQPDFPTGLLIDDLVKASQDGVYYLGSDGMRHVFVHFRIYQSWYGDDFSRVQVISDAELASIPLGAPVTYRPGTMITAPSVNEVYLIDVNRTLRHINTEAIAVELFGADWAKQVKDIEESLLFSYTVGTVISDAREISIEELLSLSILIDDEL